MMPKPIRTVLSVLLLALLAAPDPAADEPLEKRVRDRDKEVRSAAVREVRGSPSLKGVRLIFPLLADEDAYVRLTFGSGFRATIGQFKRPFDVFELTSSTQTLVIERAGGVDGVSACAGPGGRPMTGAAGWPPPWRGAASGLATPSR